MCVFVYETDGVTQPARDRKPMTFREIYLWSVDLKDFRRNPRSELGTRTATLHRQGIEKLRKNWVYKVRESCVPFLKPASLGKARRAISK